MPPLDNDNLRNSTPKYRFHPVHCRLIDHLVNHKVGLFNKSYKIKRLQRCGQIYPRMDGEKHFDLFLLSVPVCGDEILDWQVVLNEYDPYKRPDFKVFHLGFSQFLARNLARSGFFHYDANETDALLVLVERLKKMYYEYVLFALNRSSHVYHNLSHTLEMLGGDIPYELYHARGSVDFALPLTIDLSSVQLTLIPDKCTIILILTSPYPHEADVDYQARLDTSPELHEQLCLNQFKMPKFTRERPMLQFIRFFTTRLQGHLHELALLQAARKRFLLACVALCRSSLVHWDAINFTAGTLLLSAPCGDARVSFLVRLALGDHVFAQAVSIYTGRVLNECSARLDSNPKEILARLTRDSETERWAHSAVRGLVDVLKVE